MIKLYQYGIGVGVGLYTITIAIVFYGELIGRTPNTLVLGLLSLATMALLIPSTAWGGLKVLRAERNHSGSGASTWETERSDHTPDSTPEPVSRSTESPEPAPGATSQTLRDLQSLFEQGLLTQEEYERKRETLLVEGDDSRGSPS